MRNKLMVVGAAALMVAAAVVVIGLNVSPVSAQVDLGVCRPLGVGWTCSCSTSVVPNVVCLRPDGSPGHVLVTTCRSCPPPCSGTPCNIQLCHTTTSVTCG